jgi:hypothetical protein
MNFVNAVNASNFVPFVFTAAIFMPGIFFDFSSESPIGPSRSSASNCSSLNFISAGPSAVDTKSPFARPLPFTLSFGDTVPLKTRPTSD